MGNHIKPELLAPAGDLDKLKVAIRYGADAVFIGGKQFSLRAKASNFDLAAIQEGVEFAHAQHAKVYVTVNIYPHNEDFKGLDEYLLALDAIQVDAIIVSSIAIIQRAKALNCRFEIHLSTQQSVANQGAIAFWQQLGVDRIVLARELSVHEIAALKQQTTLPLEVFVHGGMCSAFSGRCTLSNNFTNRDANRGGCAHSCRWAYDIFAQNQQISSNQFRMGSKDLAAFEALPALIDAGVDSFKIEGRMKSLHYIATVVQAYRIGIDTYLATHKKDFQFFQQLANKAENRASSTGFLLSEVTQEGTLYDASNEVPPQDFIGIVLEHSLSDQFVKMQQRNTFDFDDELEIITPSGQTYTTTIIALYDEHQQPITKARHAMQTLYLELNQLPPPHSIIRKKQEV